MKIVLASTSPYRKMQLEQLGLTFSCQKPNCDEDQYKKSIADPFELSKVLAFEKAKSCLEPDTLVIAGDQVAACEGRLLSKPGNFKTAVEQLQFMAHRTHSLFSAVSIQSTQAEITWVVETQLKMKELTLKQIENYVTIDLPFDCAGSYKIEKCGLQLMQEIKTTDFSAIVGLPLLSLADQLKVHFNIHTPALSYLHRLTLK